MDKGEYKIRSEEIKSLVSDGEYAQAAEIADTIDWRRVKSVTMLCMVSDLYKINKRYEDARDVLLLAYDRHPGGRAILYSLCELSIKLNDVVNALEYYKEFVKAAPRDTGRYVLKYKLYEAQDVGLEERIEVLQDLKKRDYREKWAYELAYLYYQAGHAAECVEECDEMILWFGEGKYVWKAMELKMQYEPLSETQQEKYDMYLAGTYKPQVYEPSADEQSQDEAAEDEEALQAQESEQSADEEAEHEETVYEEETAQTIEDGQQDFYSVGLDKTQEFVFARERAWADAGISQEEGQPQEIPQGMDNPASEGEVLQESNQETAEDDIHVSTVNVGEYSTIDLQKELAEGLREILGDDYSEQADEAEEIVPDKPGEEIDESTVEAAAEEEPVAAEEEPATEEKSETEEESVAAQEESETEEEPVAAQEEPATEEKSETEEESVTAQELVAAPEPVAEQEDAVTEEKQALAEETSVADEPSEEIARLLSMNSDGQISMVISGDPVVEKQITGQMSIEEIMDALEKESLAEEEDEYLDEGVEELEETEDSDEEETVEEEAVEEESDGSVYDDLNETPAENPDEETGEETPVTSELMVKAQELFSEFIRGDDEEEKLMNSLDQISFAAYTGNVIVTGDEGVDLNTLSKNVLSYVKITDSNFTGKAAVISGNGLNGKDVSEVLNLLNNGALIVHNVLDINEGTASALNLKLQQESLGIIVVLEDIRRNINKFLSEYPNLAECFNVRIEISAMSDDDLVTFGREYAREKEYSIDDMGILALHTRIAERQSIDHAVTVAEVQEIVDEAIRHSGRRNLKHFASVLAGKRYDDEDMIILKENDFEE